MKKIKITQVKSAIDRPERQKLTLRALGLNKMNASREVEATDQIMGMVRTVNHLLKIDEPSALSSNVQESDTAVLEEPQVTKQPRSEKKNVPDSFFAQAPAEPIKGAVLSKTPETQLEESQEPVEDAVVNELPNTQSPTAFKEAPGPVKEGAVEEPESPVAGTEEEESKV